MIRFLDFFLFSFVRLQEWDIDTCLALREPHCSIKIYRQTLDCFHSQLSEQETYMKSCFKCRLNPIHWANYCVSPFTFQGSGFKWDTYYWRSDSLWRSSLTQVDTHSPEAICFLWALVCVCLFKLEQKLVETTAFLTLLSAFCRVPKSFTHWSHRLSANHA